MSDEEIPADEDESERGEGEGTLPSKVDIKLWRRALRENWPISAEDRNQIIRDMMEAFILSGSTRDKINAAKVIMLGDSLNVKRASMIGAAHKASQPGTQVNVNVGVQVNQAVQSAVGSEPEYLEWVRQRELAEGGNTDAVGSNGFAAKVPHATPRMGNGQSGNGHHSGN